MKSDNSGQAMIEYIVIVIFVALPLMGIIGLIIKKMLFLYHITDLLMKIPVF